ncbi:hypothetical protein [Ruegeria sp. Ofav3-42]|uniref:hypothetical protein n=1 Tax=Ruegeria sp. Ofav3-42 TaxID=2917759 RepID=UPI001EF5942D|nr:hypothetical protein [Ruegeria sp. Ofav3-42]MCG7520275.1 hypothetical protein [Ruegeria sp. Ofav3-42]
MSYAAQLIFGLVLGTIPSLSTAEQVKKDHLCFELWQGQVAKIRSAFPGGFSSNQIVYFAGSDGRTFDCLNVNAPSGVLEESEFWSQQIAPHADEIAKESGEISVNFCNLSHQNIGGFRVVVVHLPYEKGELSSSTCQKRIRDLADRTKDSFK